MREEIGNSQPNEYSVTNGKNWFDNKGANELSKKLRPGYI